MHQTIENTARSPLALPSPIPLVEHPAAVYLATLSPGSRPTMRQALNAIALALREQVSV